MSYLKKTHVSESLLVNLLDLYFKNAPSLLKRKKKEFHLEFAYFTWLWYFRGQSSVTVKGIGSTGFGNTELFGVMVVVLVCFYGTGSHVALAYFQLIRYLRMTFCSWSIPCIWNNLVKRKEPIGINYLYLFLSSHWKRTGKSERASSGVPHSVFFLGTHTPWPVLFCWWGPLIYVLRNKRLTI